MNWLAEAKVSLDDDKPITEQKEEVKKPTTELPEYFHVFDEPSTHVKTTGDLINEFTSTLIDAGFQLPDGLVETDTEPMRCDVDGCKPSTKPGWYYFKRSGDAAFGSYGDWRLGGHTNWAGFLSGKPSQSEIAEINARMKEHAEAVKKEREILAAAATKYVQSKISALPRLTKHKYFADKKISAIIAQVEVFKMGVAGVLDENAADMVLPIYNVKGETVNWQRINSSGTKLFKKHAVKKGNFHIIGDVESSPSIVYCEGFATGASISLALNCAVVVCFDSGNLLPVMYSTRKLVDGKTVFIGADNDASETGVKAAEKCRDKFPDTFIAMPELVGMDFNDIWCAEDEGEGKRAKAVLDRFVKAGFQVPERAELRIWDGKDLLSTTPELLKTIPCTNVQSVAEWMESTAPKSSRQVALLGAITLACGAASRVFMENERGNFSPIMGCLIAGTGTGKDFIKKCIHKVLLESNQKSLKDVFGGSSFTSEAALRAHLIQSPVRISVIDEFGDKLARGLKGNGRDSEAFEAMKEVYSDSRGVWGGRSYAMPDGQNTKKDLRAEPIHNPCLTMLGMSTPQQFVDALTSSHVEGGFLNRLIVMDARNDRITKRRKIELGIPDWIIKHCEAVVDRGDELKYGNMGNLEDMSRSYSNKADPKIINISTEVSNLFFDFDDYLDDEYQHNEFMRNVSCRWLENARRLCVGLAAFEDPYKPVITTELAQWCISFVQYHGKKLAALIDRYSTQDPKHKQRNDCLEAIRETLHNGMSRTDMNKIFPFKGMAIKNRNEVLNDLQDQGAIGVNMTGLEKKGEVRYYALKV